MLSLIAIAFLLKRYGTEAVPLPAPTSTSSPFDTPIFARDNPSNGCHSRTVLDIIWSCLATTFACTWVSVHPNVPFKGEGKWTLLGRRIYLMFFSILAPEFMIVWAFKQWRGAVMIREAVNEASEKAFPDEQDSRRNSWTTTHGHLLQMGGFRISCTPRESKLYNSLRIERQRNQRFYRRETSEGTWTTDPFSKCHSYNDDDTIWEGALSFDVLQRLLTDNLIHFPTITEDEINDRSKGDALSKGVALLQLTWFIVQIITRAAQGLVITELELTTAALAGLNSVMYIFWWSKPRDVRFPMVIRTKAVEELLVKRTEDTTWSFSDQKEFVFPKHLLTSMSTQIRKIGVFARHLYSSLCECNRYLVNRSVEHDEVNYVALRDVSINPSGKAHNISSHNSKLQKTYKTVVDCFAFLFSLPAYVINLILIMPISQIIENDGNNHIPVVFDTQGQKRVFCMMFYSEDAEQRPLFNTASLAGALFGGVHCLAWHFSFPLHVEQIMWRAASLGIVGACALSLVNTNMWTYIDDIDIVKDDGLLRIIVYPVFRLMLLVLAVTSIRSLPSSAFDTVQWIEFVPHI